MLAPEQILHAAMILSVESEDGIDNDLISSVQTSLECDESDADAAMDHINNHRDEGNWGGRSEAVLHRSRERVREAMDDGRLPSVGDVADKLSELLGDDDDGEIDPFAELGVASSGGGGIGGAGAVIKSNDPLAAFMDDDDEEEEAIVDESGFMVEESSLFGEDDDEESEPEPDEEPEEEPEPEPEPAPETSASEAYEMLMSTCWIDGILDPAEAKLLARKRQELGITFEQHLDILRVMLERSS